MADDWKAKLEGLNKELQARERVETEQRASVLKTFRQRLSELETVLKAAAEFGDAFGVDCVYEISRFDQRYPSVTVRILKPALEYKVECRDGRLFERLKRGLTAAPEQEITLDEISVKRFQERVTQWVQAAADANRKVPGRRS